MRQITRLVAVGFLGLYAAGCVALGAIAYKAAGAPKTPAEYKLGKEPAVVVVENFANPDLYEVQAERLDRDVSRELTENKAGNILDSTKLSELKNRNPQAFSKMSIPAIGKALGAARVIYVNLAEFNTETAAGSDVVRGSARAMVKVVDSRSGRTLWPPDTSSGREIKFESPDVRELESTDSQQEKMYLKLGGKIAGLFYDAPTDEMETAGQK